MTGTLYLRKEEGREREWRTDGKGDGENGWEGREVVKGREREVEFPHFFKPTLTTDPQFQKPATVT